MTELVESTDEYNDWLNFIQKKTGASIEGAKRVIIKIDRGKQIIDSGDCYIIKGDRNGSKEEN